MALESYRDIIGQHTVRPTQDQITAFVNYVSNAHSWYKHLPGLGPGAEFFLFINPAAGYARKLNRTTGQYDFRIKQVGEKFFHYNQMPTQTYHTKFGHLAFSSKHGTIVFLKTAQGLSSSKVTKPYMFLPDGTHLEMPEQILEAARCSLTGVISDYFHSQRLYDVYCNSPQKIKKDFDLEQPLISQLFNEINKQELYCLSQKKLSEGDLQMLKDYIVAERKAQQDKMKSTLNKVVELTYD